MQAPSTPASLLAAARRPPGSAPPGHLAHEPRSSFPALDQPVSGRVDAKELLTLARSQQRMDAVNSTSSVRATLDVSGPTTASLRDNTEREQPWLSPYHAIFGAEATRAGAMLQAVSDSNQTHVHHAGQRQVATQPEASVVAPAPHALHQTSAARASALLHAVNATSSGAAFMSHGMLSVQHNMPPSLVFDFSRAAAERRQNLAQVSLHNPVRTTVGQPQCPGASTPSTSQPGAQFETPESLQAGDTAFQPPPAPTPEPIITIVNGKLYKPAALPGTFSRICAAVASARKRRTVSAPTEYPLAREPPPKVPAGTNQRRRPGLSHPDEELDLEPPGTSAEKKAKQVEAEVERTISLFTSEMAQRMLPFSDAEIAQAARSEETLTAALRDILSKKCERHLTSMANARRSLLALYDYAQSTGVTLSNFKASVGLISAFLSSQTATTMPASRLTGLAWAQKNFNIEIPADDSVLASYKEVRGSGANHATTTPPKIMCHYAVVASTKSAPEYIRAGAAGLHMLGAGSLRYGDAQRSTWRVLSDCIEGYGPSKTGKAYWWAEKKDWLDGDAWYRPLLKSYKGAKDEPDFLFRRATFATGHAGDPDHFTGWGKGPAVKKHVIELDRHILQLPPLSLSPEQAIAYSRQHGKRRTYPTLARFLSHKLNLTIDDREELGRWAPQSIGDKRARKQYLANRYGSDAARTRSVQVRKSVAAAARRVIADAGWQNLSLDGGGFEAFVDGGVDFAEPEPNLSSDESDTDIP